MEDLLPTYVERLTSEETNAAVLAHLKSCPACAAKRAAMGAKETEAAAKDAEETAREVDYLKKVRHRGRRRIMLAVLATLLVLAVGFAAKVFIIGSPLDADGVAVSSQEEDNTLRVHISSRGSGNAFWDWTVDNQDGVVTITRASGSLTLPSRFMLVCAMNPCRCGWFGHPSGRCTCTDSQVQSYLRRISGPLLDRIDMHVEVPSVEYEAMRRKEQPETSQQVRSRVNAARQVQQRRYEGTGVTCNAYMTPAMIGQYCRLDAAGEKLMQGAFDRLGLTGRSHDRILRMARTIADLEGEEQILPTHLAEAIQYRSSAMLK